MGWPSIFTGRDAMQGWSPELNAFAVSKLGQRPSVIYGSGEYAGDLLGGDPAAAAEWDRRYQSEIEPAFIASLSPKRQAQYLAAKGDRSNTISKSNSLSKGLALGTIGAAAGGAALTGAGMLGAPAAATPTAGAIEAAVGIPELGLAAQTGGSSGLMGSLGGLGSGAMKWIAANPGLASMIGGTLAAAGGSAKPSTGAPQAQFLQQPGMQPGGLSQQFGQQPGLLNTISQPRLANSGLARFGATGGLFSPGSYNAPRFQWGTK